MKPVSFFFIFLFFCHSSFSQQKRLYIAIDDHTDYMWTADEAKYDSAFVKMLDYYLHQIDSTRNNPSDFQARFNTDGSIWLKAYEKYRSPAQFNKLIWLPYPPIPFQLYFAPAPAHKLANPNGSVLFSILPANVKRNLNFLSNCPA